ncbi:MAG TPA: phosphate signaling complex protein PhoU [Mesorhizobium sp.]|jgi:phosphate transport system protein|nr:phosphate signaling complex protein PhoU [Mesorhizobium sp.]
MGEHTVASFDAELEQIDRLILDMGELGARMVREATSALLNAEERRASNVIAEDAAMDAYQRELDARVVTLIAKRQPMAQDLRAVIGALRMANDLERIGDLAKNIAKRVSAVGRAPAAGTLSASIEAMSGLVLDQVQAVVDRYVGRDADALEALRMQDEKIDIRYTAIFRELLTYMMEDPRNITTCTHLLFCAKNLERIGDHVTNIAENAYYVLTGLQLPAKRPKRDETSPAPLPAI